MTASALYPWSTAEHIMRHKRRSSLPRLPNTLLDLSTYFESGQLDRFSCCNSSFFRGCVRDINDRCSIIFACTTLINNVLEHNITELHADATFKVVPNNMGYQLLTIHCMVQNYVRYYFTFFYQL